MTTDVTLMGIVNVTPDSFSDGGRYDGTKAAVVHALELAEEGAHVLDIGGESTRPGALEVPVAEELTRVLPVIEALIPQLPAGVRVSIDTRKPEVARAAIGAGASIWNDVSALTFSPESVTTAAALRCDVVLMHAQGTPETMQKAPAYTDVVEEVRAYLRERIGACEAAGIPKERLIADPGIGFGKTLAHNLALLRDLDRLADLGMPLLLGASRKRFIASLDRDGSADQRLGGSIAAAVTAFTRGARWFRIHDVAATRQALAVAREVLGRGDDG